MQVIIFDKNSPEPTSSKLEFWERENLENLQEGYIFEGKVIIAKKSDFHDLIPFLNRMDFVNCGIKKPKIELFRALKLDVKNLGIKPRRLITAYSSIRGFRKSFNSFFSNRYEPASPGCFLFIPDDLFGELQLEDDRHVAKKLIRDPMFQIFPDFQENSVTKNIKEVYAGESYEMQLTRIMIYKAAQSVLPVLILGESGTGKELIARQIYEHSKYFRKGLHVVNCSSLPEALLESELFGHKKGSFTGAIADKEGMFKTSNEGTLFLDEIGDLSLPNQAKLLRAVEDNEIRPVGSNVTIKINVRLIAATNRNLAAMMKQKAFREDLFFRLNSITVFAPPLREHPEDIPGIARIIWSKLEKPGKLSANFLNYLKNYSWPGNVRELKTLLNTLSDLFPGISPGPEHIDAIRSYRERVLREAKSNGEDDFDKMLKAQSKNRIIEVQNILRGIKIELRPLINKQISVASNRKLNQSKAFLEQEIYKLENLCREPILFKNHSLFERIKRFRYVLEKSLINWSESTVNFRNTWQNELNPLFDSIDRDIFEMIWGKMDL